MPERILQAGATGHLGRALGAAPVSAGYDVRALVRRSERDASIARWADEVVCSPATDRNALKGSARGVDAVVGAIGITLQNDGMADEDVDYGLAACEIGGNA
ncbi:NAD(P)H-binding protein [Salinarimonas chemoclinalis]|uniref:NAD(P)H-binding protein n=1 Tax=Salinarimonas chemoclinalis TaxID=3241599 RepID=UPI0035564243